MSDLVTEYIAANGEAAAFQIAEAAGCTVGEAEAELESMTAAGELKAVIKSYAGERVTFYLPADARVNPALLRENVAPPDPTAPPLRIGG